MSRPSDSQVCGTCYRRVVASRDELCKQGWVEGDDGGLYCPKCSESDNRAFFLRGVAEGKRRAAEDVRATNSLLAPNFFPSDNDVLQAVVSEVALNPTGCSAIDVLSALGYYGPAQASLERLCEAGKLRQTSPGNYLPTP